MAILIKPYKHDIDLIKNRLLNVKLHPITTIDRIAFGATLTSDDKGVVVFDTNVNAPFWWDGATWISGVSVSVDKQRDYIYDLTGTADGINEIFHTSDAFIPGTVEVWLNGLGLTPGLGYDYTEIGNVGVKFNYPPDIDSNITIEYSKL